MANTGSSSGDTPKQVFNPGIQKASMEPRSMYRQKTLSFRTVRSMSRDLAEADPQPAVNSRKIPRRCQDDKTESPQRQALRETSQETLDLLPALLNRLNTACEARQSKKVSFHSLRRLHSQDCPRFPSPATIKVINEDTLNVAVRLFASAQTQRPGPSASRPRPSSCPLIVNFASHRKPGGGWLNGALAQEESICYRSSLALSLDRTDYPLGLDEAIYSPYALVMRGDLASGHNLLMSPSTPPETLPVISTVSIAALYRPRLRTIPLNPALRRPHSNGRHERHGSGGHRSFGGHSHPHGHRNSGSQRRVPPRSHSASPAISSSHPHTRQVFERDRDRNLSKAKMRLVLRLAATNGHEMLVLGAFGCGVYANPPAEIAHCWLEVLREPEFCGNWWREVYFAVYDPKDEGNFAIFQRVLAGKKV
ncbi:hypothetical protein N7468_010680 [Penicillium chermesinum]|uniref:Microbial-type PARG catalytic domain-containing protein n=1 Tax=Penicillium chermesinum TaxID=63820 RepID=A0A9W9TA48_9EURO|nr:uncharacterized protein N7468_010680 [Penicillium chermesinum]KAJ5215001.1 hypothetical protein N7468_010680 [Penicillium chermesinum]KAJ6141498.1 hypothetical protein N7470_009888 [Penicillium chermesinum]